MGQLLCRHIPAENLVAAYGATRDSRLMAVAGRVGYHFSLERLLERLLNGSKSKHQPSDDSQ
jgi:hypothetical protein